MLSLKQCLILPDDYNWGGREDTPDGPLYYHDNGARVLGVAHLDTVLSYRPAKSGPLVFAPQLDDRLGVWCLLNALPKRGIKLDILLTTGEEKCQSTARHFIAPKRYNWVVEFDRAGTDVVFYHYTAKHWRKVWARHFRIGQGSYSDIASLYMGVCCANVGVGYHNQHTAWCHANLDDTQAQLDKFALFYAEHESAPFPYQEHKSERKRKPARVPDWYYGRWQEESGIWRDREGFFDAWEQYTEECV